jgi:hypothetical protein
MHRRSNPALSATKDTIALGALAGRTHMRRLRRPYGLPGLAKMVLHALPIEEEANGRIVQPCDFAV